MDITEWKPNIVEKMPNEKCHGFILLSINKIMKSKGGEIGST
jgi:hypothetical protein